MIHTFHIIICYTLFSIIVKTAILKALVAFKLRFLVMISTSILLNTTLLVTLKSYLSFKLLVTTFT
jgi:hypothetical protein